MIKAYRCFICGKECNYEDPKYIYLSRKIGGTMNTFQSVETLVCENCKNDYQNFIKERDEEFVKNKQRDI